MSEERGDLIETQEHEAREESSIPTDGTPSLSNYNTSRETSDPKGKTNASVDKTVMVPESALQIVKAELISSRGSTRTLLKLKPINFHGLPLDASMIEDDLSPLAMIQFCQYLRRCQVTDNRG